MAPSRYVGPCCALLFRTQTHLVIWQENHIVVFRRCHGIHVIQNLTPQPYMAQMNLFDTTSWVSGGYIFVTIWLFNMDIAMENHHFQ